MIYNSKGFELKTLQAKSFDHNIIVIYHKIKHDKNAKLGKEFIIKHGQGRKTFRTNFEIKQRDQIKYFLKKPTQKIAGFFS